MKIHSLQPVALAALLSFGLVADAAAHSPTGRHCTGTIEKVDPSAQMITFRADREERAKTFVWNKRTQFVREIGFVESSALRKGARADVTYHAPFFGEPFVSRILLLEPAPTVPRRK
jgi:hypothetical protein